MFLGVKKMLIELSQKNSQSKGKWIWAVKWFYSNDPLRFQGKAYVPNDLDVWHYVASQHHDHYVRGKGSGAGGGGAEHPGEGDPTQGFRNQTSRYADKRGEACIDKRVQGR